MDEQDIQEGWKGIARGLNRDIERLAIVVSELKNAVDKVRMDEISTLKTELAVLKVQLQEKASLTELRQKSGFWAAAATLLSAMAAMLISYYAK